MIKPQRNMHGHRAEQTRRHPHQQIILNTSFCSARHGTTRPALYDRQIQRQYHTAVNTPQPIPVCHPIRDNSLFLVRKIKILSHQGPERTHTRRDQGRTKSEHFHLCHPGSSSHPIIDSTARIPPRIIRFLFFIAVGDVSSFDLLCRASCFHPSGHCRRPDAISDSADSSHSNTIRGMPVCKQECCSRHR